MDINRVELKGRISSDVTYRKKENGNEWAAFIVVTNEYNPTAKIEKDKSVPTWTSVAVFNSALVKRIKTIGARQGSHVWLVGKLHAKNVEKKGYSCTYTSVIASEIEIFKSMPKAATETESVPEPPIVNNDNDDNIPF